MNSLTKLSLKRPVSTFLIVLALIVFGISSIFGFKLELQPDMEMPMLLVVTTYPGADRESVEELVTKEIEGAGATLSGVESYTSMVSDNYTVTMFSYDYDIDIDDAYFDLRASLDSLSASLPEDAEDPYIMELAMDASDTITLSATASSDVDLLSYVNDSVVPEMETLLRVAKVNVYGGEEKYIRVQLKEEALNQYGLTMATIAQYISAVDFSIPAGSVEQGNQDISVSSSAETKTVSQLKNIPVITATGNLITLGEVAEITESSKAADSISRYNGNNNISIGIQKKQSEGTVNAAIDIKKAVKKLQAENEAVDLQIIYDASDMILSSLKSIGETLILGIVLSMFVLFLFFGDIKGSLIVGSSMPVSLFVTLILMNAAGFSLNIVTMGALVIAIGMMVDNSIVVLESCFRLKEQHADYKMAALEGARIVTASIVASTLTTIVVYVPLSVMNGLSGQLFAQLGMTIVFAMTASLVSALTLVPLCFSKYKPKEKKKLPVNKVLDVVKKWYDKILRKILKHRFGAVVTSILLLVISFVMVYFTNVELMPTVDEGTVAITAEFRSGSRLDFIDESMVPLEEFVKNDANVESYSMTIESNTATLTCYLKDDSELSTAQVIELWNEELSDVTNMDLTIQASGTNMTSSMSMDAEVDLTGNDLEALKVASKQVEEAIRDVDGVIKIKNDLSASTTRAEIVIDPLKAMSVGYTPVQIAMNINYALSGMETSVIKNEGEEYSVMLEYPKGSYDDLNSLMNLSFMTQKGTSFVLSDIAQLTYTDSPESITRIDGQYQVAITALTTEATKFTAVDEINAIVKKLEFPEGVSLSENMVSEILNEEFTAIYIAIATAVFLVFLVMAMQFESPVFSGMVMLSIPFSLIGSFSFLYLSGATLSMVSLMGLLMLSGIVVNNGILYVDTANMLRKEMPIEDALVTSGQIRLRPILMTTLTTILSMIPMALGIGDGAVLMQGMALVIIGGLIASTVLILILLPSFYLIIYEGKKKKKVRKKKVIV
ncbi:MAG: efflux RND transporter permease subunit [Lachnospiraceae bacterium]|nr:efflux RND transporter permease subunit [Lachnospiraceae bacterium]